MALGEEGVCSRGHGIDQLYLDLLSGLCKNEQFADEGSLYVLTLLLIFHLRCHYPGELSASS